VTYAILYNVPQAQTVTLDQAMSTITPWPRG
jgi:hypothetical protein